MQESEIDLKILDLLSLSSEESLKDIESYFYISLVSSQIPGLNKGY